MKISKSTLKHIIAEKLATTEKYDDDPALKGDQDELPDELQKAIIDKANKKSKKESIRRVVRKVIAESEYFNTYSEMKEIEDMERRLNQIEEAIANLEREKLNLQREIAASRHSMSQR